MKLYTKNDEYSFKEEWYEEELEKIWVYINRKGTPHFKKDFLAYLWREYSDECWCAGFISVDEDRLKEFVDWLAKYEI